MRKKKRAFTLIELLVVVAIIALLISILLPSLSRARELSKRLVCSSNVKGMGTAFKIYANDYEEHWPTPLFNEDSGAVITYGSATVVIDDNADSTAQGAFPGRVWPSTNATTTLSVTRSFWMLVRSGDVTPKQFICPSSGDQIDNEQNIDLYYDFRRLTNISYGYQVPFGPFDTRASEDIDPRMPVGADRGPYSEGTGTLPSGMGAAWDATNPNAIAPQEWLPYNSPNHGGSGTGEGQNVLYGDGHASFEKKPIVGIDLDNIYTLMTNQWNATDLSNRVAGALVNSGANGGTANATYPGFHAISATRDASTDSLIFP